jgi:hypothetical protein
MRGIPNVGTYVDGVWQISNAGLLQRQFVELATYFCTDWIDIQAPSSVIDRTSGDPITEVITANASDGEAKGVDLEALFLATDQLSFGATWAGSITAHSGAPQYPISGRTYTAAAVRRQGRHEMERSCRNHAGRCGLGVVHFCQ